MKKSTIAYITLPVLLLSTLACNRNKAADNESETEKPATVKVDSIEKKISLTIDTLDFNTRMIALSNNDTTGRWPVKAPYPLPGALLPYNRIIAYYGNLYSTRMGILGEIPRKEMLAKLQGEVAKWQAADSTVKAIPALHYIAVTAQGAPGKNNMHRMRMPFKQIDTIISWAKPINALVFLDIQVGHSTVKAEVAELEQYLSMPNVHLGIDPEFSMKNGERPGSKIGHFTAADINDAIDILANIVRKNKLTPKVLVIHRFTQGMVKNYKEIKTVPEVQIVMDMDGFGSKILKKSTYMSYIYREPVQFTGFKLFYKNDNKNDWKMYSPEELVKFTPKPIYIQYQ
ncbi:hypothetical protein EKM05_00755 [Flavobacterium sp. GSP27]|uniref:hypothetical protein n=1 Tax=unclassified Flavobacterium TaxID=196869 RepID=UPI000F84E67C|nr:MULTISPECIES: hypothetical protein [unclassified Flavobacterium]RTY76393.1 hypothetical protein EKL96_02580 [Flavobacterium sp. LS1R10]RTY96306.1 hypothetical protein EKL32_02850 [Flavobacterium sp. GSN2]RTZ11197.1 hypothetical protein EKM05_00755 [Flavobacterium sp. GSP27]